MESYLDFQKRPQNLVLAALDDDFEKKLIAQMDLVPLPIGKILLEPGVASQHAYFPTTCVVSLLCRIENGSAAEVATIGNEGVVGGVNVLDGEASPIQAVVRSTGYAYRIRAKTLQREVEANPALEVLLNKYQHFLMAQMAQTAACNRHHTLDQQLCCWFLHCLDRIPSNELIITQEFIAQMLGVRREGVTAAAGKLQKNGIISYRRGRISIVDREGLEERACECYGIIRREYDRIMAPKKESFSGNSPVVYKTSSDWRGQADGYPYSRIAEGSRLAEGR
jgi:CRP-like cAMP-binding protein